MLSIFAVGGAWVLKQFLEQHQYSLLQIFFYKKCSGFVSDTYWQWPTVQEKRKQQKITLLLVGLKILYKLLMMLKIGDGIYDASENHFLLLIVDSRCSSSTVPNGRIACHNKTICRIRLGKKDKNGIWPKIWIDGNVQPINFVDIISF